MQEKSQKGKPQIILDRTYVGPVNQFSLDNLSRGVHSIYAMPLFLCDFEPMGFDLIVNP